MKLLRLAIFSIIILFLIMLGISLFIPSHIRISRMTNIRSSTDSVFNKINDINNWKEWYPGFDSLNVEPLASKDGRLISGKFSSTTVSITENQRMEVKAELKSANRNPIISRWQASAYNNTDSLALEWSLEFTLKWYPWEKFLSLAYDKMYGTQMEQGLKNLKKSVER